MKRARVLISGLVQGVFFRHHTREKAQGLGLTGWVRNTDDGRVEAVFEGEREKVEEMVKWCHQGPAAAQVEKVDIIWEEYKGEFSEFEIK